ncbi:MAG: ATP-binding protein [Winogradskyella sp.]|nr:MAG: ATP-binding protein [Winogradskyella sp.]
MPILQDIIEWIEDKPQFWQEAVNRIIRNKNLTEDDIDDLVEICKAEQGVLNVEIEDVDLEELKELVASADIEESITLSKICNTENINALKENEELEFATSGLTIVYGDNGAGKSSYVSVLKHICNTRGVRPNINPNLFVNGSYAKSQTAELEYTTESGGSGSAVWKDGNLNNHTLQAVDVFDTYSANHYIEDEDEIAFIPSGLTVLEKLAQCCKDVESKINEDKDVHVSETFDYSFLIDEHETEVAKFLTELDKDSKTEDLKKHTNHTEASEKRIHELEKQIVKLKATNPQKIIRENSNKIKRFKILKDKLSSFDTDFSEETLKETKKVINEFVTSSEASKVASEKAFSNLPIEDVGNEHWKTLWESARKFYDHSFGGGVFPSVNEDDNCPLCLQDLDENARQRFTNFETFVKADLQKKLDVAITDFDEEKEYFDELDFDLKQYAPTLEELEEIHDGFGKKLDDHISTLKVEQAKIVKLFVKPKTVEVLDATAFEESPVIIIEAIEKTLTDENEKLGKVAIKDELKPLEDEYRNLVAVKNLQKFEQKLIDEIARKKTINSLAKCVGTCGTRAITLCSNGISEDYVTNNLKDNFKEELRKLGFKDISVIAGTKGVKGKQYHYLELDTSYGVSVSLKDILSEGEHRCISLATFFSELSISEHKSAIIFDDPVSSLDHKWRSRISKRIIEESKKRQVIVFTHDITFLMMLQEVAKRENCDVDIKSLTRKKTETGILAKNPPWDALTIKKRIGILNAEFQTLEKIEKNETEEVYRENVKPFYGKLRETWERSIEEIVLNGTVQRFSREVQTKRLKKVVDFKDDDYQIIEDNMSKCSTMFLGHDSAGALIENMPDADEVKADLKVLVDFVSQFRPRRN